MADICKLKINNVEYDLKDATARSLIQSLQNKNYLSSADIINRLDSTETSKALSANQGNQLNINKIDNVTIKKNIITFIANDTTKCTITLPDAIDNANQIIVKDTENIFVEKNVEDVLNELYKYIKKLEKKLESLGIEPDPIYYSIINNLAKCSSSNNISELEEGSEYVAIITADSDCEMESITVMMNGENITSSVVTPIGYNETFLIENNLTNCTNDNALSSILHDEEYTATIIPNDGYEMESIVVTMGGKDVTFKVVTEINDINTYSIKNDLTNCTTDNISLKITHDEEYMSIITPIDGYEMESIVVTMGGEDITSSVVTEVNSDNNNEDNNREDTDMMPKMTYGKGINQTTGEIKNNPECWATVNPVTVIVGQTYTISLDATWVWVVSCNDNGDVILPFLTTGTNSKPQSFTFTANTTKVRFGCYDPDKTLTYCTLVKKEAIAPGGGSNKPIEPNPGSVDETISIMAVNPVTISDDYATGEIVPDRGTGITNLTVSRGQTFSISYCTNLPAVKHELSWDYGVNYSDVTSSITKVGNTSYNYVHGATSDVSSYNMAIRVTDGEGKTSTRTFVITFV